MSTNKHSIIIIILVNFGIAKYKTAEFLKANYMQKACIMRFYHVCLHFVIWLSPMHLSVWCTCVIVVHILKGYSKVMDRTLLSYGSGLFPEAKARYVEKMLLIGRVDLFLGGIIPGAEVTTVFPPLDASDVVSYLMLKTSFLIPSQYKACKSLDAYNQLVCGWVKDVTPRKISGKYLICGRVSLYNDYRYLFSIYSIQ